MPQTIVIGANDPNITYLLQRYAEESGFQTAHACHGQGVMEIAHRLQPTLIILDIELGDTTSPEILRRLKTEPDTCHIPVVIYSCLDEPPDEWANTADGYLYKSVMYDDFLDEIAQRYPGGSLFDIGCNNGYFPVGAERIAKLAGVLVGAEAPVPLVAPGQVVLEVVLEAAQRF